MDSFSLYLPMPIQSLLPTDITLRFLSFSVSFTPAHFLKYQSFFKITIEPSISWHHGSGSLAHSHFAVCQEKVGVSVIQF